MFTMPSGARPTERVAGRRLVTREFAFLNQARNVTVSHTPGACLTGIGLDMKVIVQG
jgi:hypothetical protein